MTENQKKITAVCDELKELLLEKNERYGDSALSPDRIFCKADAVSGICLRLDDKLSRIRNGAEIRKNDTVDIMGYLVLLAVAKGWLDFSDLID
jgi:hypothetical protein